MTDSKIKVPKHYADNQGDTYTGIPIQLIYNVHLFSLIYNTGAWTHSVLSTLVS